MHDLNLVTLDETVVQKMGKAPDMKTTAGKR